MTAEASQPPAADDIGFDIYLDESGNTGLDFLNPDQSVFVLAGWLVPRSCVGNALNVVATATAHLPGKRREIKGATILKNRRGEAAGAHLVFDMMEIGCVPTFAVIEKRYAACAKIVEAFFDPAFNPLLELSFTYTSLTKQEIAERIYSLSDDVVSKAWYALTRPTADRLRNVLSMLATAMDEVGEFDIARYFVAANDGVEAMIEVEESVLNDPIWRHGDGLPVPALISMLGSADAIGEGLGVSDICVFHDETRQFAPVLQSAFFAARDAAKFRLTLANGNEVRLGFSAVRDLVFARSESSPLIQAADVLAATLGSRARRPDSARMPGSLVGKAYRDVLATALMDMPHERLVMGSNAFIREVFAPVVEHSKTQNGS